MLPRILYPKDPRIHRLPSIAMGDNACYLQVLSSKKDFGQVHIRKYEKTDAKFVAFYSLHENSPHHIACSKVGDGDTEEEALKSLGSFYPWLLSE